MRWPKAAGWLPPIGRGALDRLELDEFAWRSKRRLEGLCRARAQPVQIGGNEAMCRILGRYKLYVDARDRGLGAHLLLDGYWEMGLTMFVARHVRRGMVAVDVGANYGYYTMLLAGLVGPRGRVCAIEPAPRAAALLRHSVALNGFHINTAVVEAAAGGTDAGPALLYVPHNEPKNARIVASREETNSDTGALHEVARIRIDDVPPNGCRVDFVKVDAEGAEEEVIAGMLAILRRDRPLLVLEFNAGRARDAAALLETLCRIYGSPRCLDLQGKVHPTTPARLISDRVGVDWLLVFAA